MKVTAKNHDEVSALLTVTVEKSDYKEKVEKQLRNYAKNAEIKGFRKGKVPLSMIKKQYEVPATYEEINNLVNETLNKYIQEKDLRLVGQPIPQTNEALDLNQEQHKINFEVGFEPKFTVDLTSYKAPFFKVEASDKEVSQSIENMQKRFANQVPQEKIANDSHVALEITQIVEENAEGEHNHPPKNITINALNKEAFKLVEPLKMDGTIKITKEELTKNEDLAKEFGFSKEEVDHLHHDELQVKVVDFYGLEDHEVNQELFDKVYGKDVVKSEDELKTKIKTELDEYFQQNAEVHFVNKVLEQVNEKEEVELPENFLVKFLMFSNKEIETEDKAKEIFEAEKKQIKQQIIESKLLSDNDVKVEYADVLAQAEQAVRNQLAMYGIHQLGDEEVQKYAAEMLKNEEQVRQVSSEVAMNKLKEVVLEKAKKQEKTISHDEFLEEIKK